MRAGDQPTYAFGPLFLLLASKVKPFPRQHELRCLIRVETCARLAPFLRTLADTGEIAVPKRRLPLSYWRLWVGVSQLKTNLGVPCSPSKEERSRLCCELRRRAAYSASDLRRYGRQAPEVPDLSRPANRSTVRPKKGQTKFCQSLELSLTSSQVKAFQSVQPERSVRTSKHRRKNKVRTLYCFR
jgi:hypothetical protein